MVILILGCGRVGARLARMLDSEGHDVRVIDQNVESFQRLPASFRGAIVLGQGTDDEVLVQAGVDQAGAFAAVTNDDNTNIMAAQIAKVIHRVPKVITRIYDPVREEAYRPLPVETVCPTELGAELVEKMLEDAKLDVDSSVSTGTRDKRS